VAGLAAMFGSGAMTNPISDIYKTACIMSIGSNTTEAHPVIGVQVKQAVRRGAKLIVINPRRIELVKLANVWLRPKPGTNVALLMGMARIILEKGLHDPAYVEGRCENFEPFRQSLEQYDLQTVAGITGVPAADIVKAAELYATCAPATIMYAMGVTQHSFGTNGVMAVANLAMLTGNVGKPGSGVNPLRGQNNVQGACDMGALPDVYPGYQKVTDEAARSKFAAAWGRVPEGGAGLTLTEMAGQMLAGKIKAVYLMGENPLLSEPDLAHVRSAFASLEFLAVQDIFLTETAELAHVVLPGTSFAEKDGTFTNTERRIQRVRKAVEPVGQSRPDWQIVCALASRMGAAGFDYHNSKQIMHELKGLAPIYGGVSHESLEELSLQWPCPEHGHPGTPVLHCERFSRGLGRFMPIDYSPPAESPDEEYPLLLTTGRNLYQFHTGTMTRRVKGLSQRVSEEKLEINPQDAAALGVADGETVKISSRRGSLSLKTQVTDITPPGVVYMTFHFWESPVNLLTGAGRDPTAKTPDYKVCAVRVEKLTEATHV
jgi:formate dehydrogenase alpha subunit